MITLQSAQGGTQAAPERYLTSTCEGGGEVLKINEL